MGQSEPNQKKADAKAARAARRAATKAQKAREAEELRSQTTRQLEAAISAVAKIENEVVDIRNAEAQRKALFSHLEGFYAEIDKLTKLTKGQLLIPVTDLVVNNVNEIVREAKLIVSRDPHLDRVKEFVAAGENPAYPDVLLKARMVIGSLERFGGLLEARGTEVEKLLREAKTIQFATQYYVENGEIPSKEQAREALGGGQFLTNAWFVEDESGQESFDFDKLDRCDIKGYFSLGDVKESCA
jgi:hypothetical protein